MRIKDIAREINVSSTTISRVLNKRGENYSKDTEKKVLDALEKYDYTPNLIARNLKRKKTFDIGILIPEFSFYSEIYSGAQQIVKQYGYNLLLACSNYNREDEKIALTDFLERKVDGLLITTLLQNQEFLKAFKSKNIPVVVLEKFSGDYNGPLVYYDNYKIIKNVVDHLVENDYKNPALILGSTKYLFNAIERIDAFKKALKDNNLKIREENIIADERVNYFDTSASINLISELMAKSKKPDALLISRDILAIIMIDKLTREGFKIPGDIGILGFDNIAFSQYIKPSLTCIDVQSFTFGSEAAKLLIELIEKEQVNQNVIEIEPKLMIRESTSRLKA
jgi:LacI family transcriptional regulator